ncbi:Tetratricopeptide TPR_2 [Rubrobacter xylanophilus DSM 9941]|uniref:Tetratricopeptide TPR_2 n=1 Tax=Rubrobacter xylanophilus (strain DSM 9941 / JCM 11954 / NBRC 16129 / PRD-1) TaxID=266117 RepID=Q1AUL1_RUBXD|nr:tetratricopeptide repeat protein [Rubrobacter xylanophilus]ABG04917.1 Tetratricopeptide TPR_2 [Rubrobacter xylanophilus DSM 9941]
MMINRERISFWARLFAIGLSVIFIGSFVLFGIGSNVSYNIFDLIGGQDQRQTQTSGGGIEEQIARAERQVEEDPGDAEAVTRLAALYYQAGRLDDAARVLERGRERSPKDPELAMLLGQIRAQQAESASGEKERRRLYAGAAEAFAAAAKLEPGNAEAFLFAGNAYDAADMPGQAIKYWNGYLELEPRGEQAKAVKERISALLRGGGEGGGA